MSRAALNSGYWHPQLSMPDRIPQDTQTLPPSFLEDVRQAVARNRQGLLALLSREAQEYPWARAASPLVAAHRASSHPRYTHALVFTGHRIDASNRPAPRFPPQAEPAAREAILRALQDLRAQHSGSLVGLAGGASGGDLLFHEACNELNIPTLLRLTVPEPLYLETSVAPAGPDWVRRFHVLTTRLGPKRIEVLGKSLDLPDWLTGSNHYDVWQRTNLWLVHEAIALAPARTLLALWDGQPGDGPGGTQHLLEAAPRFGLNVAPIIQTSSLVR